MQIITSPTVGAGTARPNKGVYAIPGRADPTPTAYIIKFQFTEVSVYDPLSGLFRESRHPHTTRHAQKKDPLRISPERTSIKRRRPTLPPWQYHRRGRA